MTQEGTEVTQEGTEVTQEGTEVTQEGTEVTQEGTEVTEESVQCPLFSMEEWICQDDPNRDDPENCRPCRLGVISNWYYNELKEQGQEDLASNLQDLTQNKEDPDLALTICKEFDRIKDVVEEPLRERLKDFDCATQSFNPEDVVEQS